MLSSRKDSFTLQVLQIADAFLVYVAFWVAGFIRQLILMRFDGSLGSNETHEMLWVLYIAVPFTPLILEHFGFYERIRRKPAMQSVVQLIKGLVAVGLLIGLFSVFAKQTDARRLILVIGVGMAFVFLLLRDRMSMQYFKERIKKGIGRENVIIAGHPQEIERLEEELGEETLSEWNLVHRFDLAGGTVEELYQILKVESVSRVVFATKNCAFEKVGAAVEACELQGVEAWISASFVRSQIARPVFDAIGAKPMLVLRSTPELSWELMVKNVMDKVLSASLLILTLPLWLFAYIGIRMASPGAPVMFSQMRAGKYGKPFQMWKFRTMVANAEELLLKTKEEHGNQMDGPVFKLDRDPRIFSFGALLRRLSIDELPQLLNVFVGDMSLVGPRPLPLYEVEAFSEISHRRRLSVKPGITCEWQVGGRNRITSFEDWVEMDLRYIDNWSLWLDLQIILKTIPAVLFAKGAR